MFVNRGLFRDHAGLWNGAQRLLDLAVIAATGFIAVRGLGEEATTFGAEHGSLMLWGLLLAAIVFNQFGLYNAWRYQTLKSEVKRLCLAWGVVACLMFFGFWLSAESQGKGRFLGASWFLLGLCGLTLVRVGFRLLLRALRRYGYNQRKVLLIGTPHAVAEISTRFQKFTWMGLCVTACLQVDEETGLFDEQAFGSFTDSRSVDQIWVALPLRHEPVIRRIIDLCALAPIEISFVPDLEGLNLFSHSISEVDGLPVINLSSTPLTGVNRALKCLEDYSLATVSLLMAFPLLVLIAVLIKSDSKGPILFRQQRIGVNGQPITVLKFRTMVEHEEPPGRLVQATAGDVRVTRIGSFLRRTSLDELPQLWNVLRGDMSIVGPRPFAILHNDQYKTRVENYVLRYRVKPGITGWAQVHGYRGATDTHEKLQKRIDYDLYYIEHWSVGLDLKIVLMTLIKGFIHKNAY